MNNIKFTGNFQADILKFNGIYKLPISSTPSLTKVGDPLARLKAFKEILLDEVDEIDNVIDQVQLASSENYDNIEANLEALTALADLLGDVQVYCASEMAKFGLPNENILPIIMQSNFSKLGADGLPIYDERGKVQKGPNYWKPEPMIKEFLRGKL